MNTSASPVAPNALFINGIYESVLMEILKAQAERGGGVSFLQPHSGYVINSLRAALPSPQSPARLYASTGKNLACVSYTADIVGWEDTREMSNARYEEVLAHLNGCQSGEVALFEGRGKTGKRPTNLITIQNLRRLETPFPVGLLIKVKSGQPYRERSQPGGWSEVHDVGGQVSVATQAEADAELAREVDAMKRLSEAELAARLERAPRIPQRVQIVSMGFRRSAVVIAAALRRAKGVCEKCHAPAPFTRRADDSPYLEVHHWQALSQGGEDTLENAAALCPNCHREAHHG